MQTSFKDLVGTSAIPAHCLDNTELTDLTPVLDLVTTAHDLTVQASEGRENMNTSDGPTNCPMPHLRSGC